MGKYNEPYFKGISTKAERAGSKKEVQQDIMSAKALYGNLVYADEIEGCTDLYDKVLERVREFAQRTGTNVYVVRN